MLNLNEDLSLQAVQRVRAKWCSLSFSTRAQNEGREREGGEEEGGEEREVGEEGEEREGGEGEEREAEEGEEREVGEEEKNSNDISDRQSSNVWSAVSVDSASFEYPFVPSAPLSSLSPWLPAMCVVQVSLVAQLVEHSPRLQSVVGLNPTQGSSFFPSGLGCSCFAFAHLVVGTCIRKCLKNLCWAYYSAHSNIIYNERVYIYIYHTTS